MNNHSPPSKKKITIEKIQFSESTAHHLTLHQKQVYGEATICLYQFWDEKNCFSRKNDDGDF